MTAQSAPCGGPSRMMMASAPKVVSTLHWLDRTFNKEILQCKGTRPGKVQLSMQLAARSCCSGSTERTVWRAPKDDGGLCARGGDHAALERCTAR